MALIEPTKLEADNPSIIKKNSSAIRFWHWLNAIAIIGLLITVLINSTVLKPRKTASIVQTEMKNSGTTVTIDQARNVVNALSDKVWEIHVYIGFFLVALFVFRLITEFFQLTEQKFITRFKKAWKLFFIIKQQREVSKHELVVKSIYIIFYCLLLIMVCTGLSLAFEDNLPFSKSLMHNIKDIHGFCMYLILGFICVHLAGVIMAERKDSKGIVSDMINGG